MPACAGMTKNRNPYLRQLTVTLFEFLAATTGAGIIPAHLRHCIRNRSCPARLIQQGWREQLFGRGLGIKVGVLIAHILKMRLIHLLLGSGDQVIARFLGSEGLSAPFVDHFRQNDQKTDYYWEERWVRDEGVSKFVPAATKALLKRLGKSGEQVAFFGLAGGPTGAAKLLTKPLGIAPERVLPDLQGQVGDTGAAQSVLLLISALEQAKPGDLIVIASFAQGVEVIAFEMQQSAPATGRRGLAGSIAQRIPETAYLKMLSFEGHLELDWGMRSEVDGKTAQTTLYRNADQIYAFVGGKCDACGAVQFPRMPAWVNCGAVDSQKPQRLAEERAKVVTYTADWLQFSLSPPLYMGLVQFDIGARVLMEIVDVGPSGIDLGTPLEMTFRIKERDTQRHSDRYFWKATPVV